jgi:hypothetical protein
MLGGGEVAGQSAPEAIASGTRSQESLSAPAALPASGLHLCTLNCC